jgi:hypothetical protein
MERGHTAPNFPTTRPAPHAQHSYDSYGPPAPPPPIDPYYEQMEGDQGGPYGYQQDDARSTYSHTALRLEPEKDYYAGAPPLPPVQNLAYESLSYPPSTPLMRPPPSPFAGNMYPQGSYYQQPAYYSQARENVMQRREAKKVELVDGHLVMDLPVPKSIQQFNHYKGEDMSEESGKMRWVPRSHCDEGVGTDTSMGKVHCCNGRPRRLYSVSYLVVTERREEVR